MNTYGEVLSYLTQFTIKHGEHIRGIKKTSKSEIKRHEDIAQIGLRGCGIFGVTPEVAQSTGFPRLAYLLKEYTKNPVPSGVKTFYTLEETALYLLECTMATLACNLMTKSVSKYRNEQLNEAINKSLEALKALGVTPEQVRKTRCGRVHDALFKCPTGYTLSTHEDKGCNCVAQAQKAKDEELDLLEKIGTRIPGKVG